uniref:Uncharacterized protein n=1 Tax=Glossina pallidipes TaxID=7398 RepID=A0A1B0A794_GLOPL
MPHEKNGMAFQHNLNFAQTSVTRHLEGFDMHGSKWEESAVHVLYNKCNLSIGTDLRKHFLAAANPIKVLNLFRWHFNITLTLAKEMAFQYNLNFAQTSVTRHLEENDMKILLRKIICNDKAYHVDNAKSDLKHNVNNMGQP